MSLPSGSNDFPLGLYKVNIEGKEYTPESIDLPTKVTRLIQRYDEFGDPSDFQIRLASEKMTGTIVLQRPTSNTFEFNTPVFNNIWFRSVFQGIIANKKNYGESAPEIPSAGMKIYATGNFGQEGHLFGYITNVKVVRSKSEADKIECGIVIERYSKGVIAMHAKTYGDQSSMFMNPLQTYNEDNVLPHFKDFPNLTTAYKTIPNTLTVNIDPTLIYTGNFSSSNDGLVPNSSNSFTFAGGQTYEGKSNVLKFTLNGSSIERQNPQLWLNNDDFKDGFSGSITFEYYVESGSPLVGKKWVTGSEAQTYSKDGVTIVGGAWSTATVFFGSYYGGSDKYKISSQGGIAKVGRILNAVDSSGASADMDIGEVLAFSSFTASVIIPNTNGFRDQVRSDFQAKKVQIGNGVTDSFCEWTTVGGKRVLRLGGYRATANLSPYGNSIVIKGLKKGAFVSGLIFPQLKNKIRFRIRCLNGSNNGDGRAYGTNNSTTRIQFQGQTNINTGAVRYNHGSTFLEADISRSLNYYQNDTFNVRIASKYQSNTSTPTTGWVGCEIEFLDIIEEPQKQVERVCDNTLKNWWLTFPKQLVFMTNYMRYYFNEWYWQVAPPKDNAYHKIGYIPADQGTVNIGLPTSDKNNLNAEPKKPEQTNLEVNRVSNFARKISSFQKGKNKFSSFIEGWSDNDLSTKGIKIEDYSFDCDTDLPTFSNPYEGTDVKLATANSFSWDSNTRTLSVDATSVTPNSGSAYNPRQVVAICALPSSLIAKETALTKVRVSGSLDTFVKRLVETSDFTVNDDGLAPNQSSTKLSVGRIASAFDKDNVVEIKNLQRCTPQIGLGVSAYKTSTSGKIEFTYYVPTGHPLVGNYFHLGTQRTAQGEEISYSGTGVQIVGGAWTTATLTYGKLYGVEIDKPNNISRFITVLDQYKADGVPATVASEANDVWYLSEYKLYTDNTIEIVPAQGLNGTGRWTPTNGTPVIDRLGSFSKEFYLPNNGNYLRAITFRVYEGENIVISNLRVQIVEAPIYLIIGQGFADNSGTSSNPIYPNSMGLQSREKRHIIDPDTGLPHSNGFINDSDNTMTDARHLGDPNP